VSGSGYTQDRKTATHTHTHTQTRDGRNQGSQLTSSTKSSGNSKSDSSASKRAANWSGCGEVEQAGSQATVTPQARAENKGEADWNQKGP
jgi:hypothetical protein